MSLRLPPDLVSLQDYARRAADCLPPATWAWLQGGSGDERTLAANREAFSRWQLVQRLCRRGPGSTRLTLFGRELQHPILLAPIACHALACPEAEIATAQAAEATDTAMLLSCLSSRPLEAVAGHAPAERWMQCYLDEGRQATLALLQRAADAGFRAAVLTLDAPVRALPRQAQRLGFSLPDSARCNLGPPPGLPRRVLSPGQSPLLGGLMAEAVDLDDVSWLVRHSPLPVIAKGVTQADDARQLIERGVSGLIISNHGGRSLDGLPATLDLLPGLRAALGPDMPLLLDGGIRSGTDVFKALALGADAVLLGRAQLHGLAVAGALGLAHLLRLLREELELCMAQSGCLLLDDIDRRALYAASDNHGRREPC